MVTIIKILKIDHFEHIISFHVREHNNIQKIFWKKLFNFLIIIDSLIMYYIVAEIALKIPVYLSPVFPCVFQS